MNSQRGKASTNASRQNKSQNSRQANKSQTNVSKRQRRPRPQRRPITRNFDTSNTSTVRAVAAAYGTTNITREPQLSRTRNSTRISNRELVFASVAGATSFSVAQTISINPGLSGIFPWLAPQAGQWQMYRIHKLEVCYVPIAPTSTQGVVYLSPNYDAASPPPTTETQASDNYGTMEFPCWENAVLKLRPDDLMGLGPRKYVRPCAIAGDIKTYDCGKVFICTNNETGTSTVGKVYLDYDIEFFGAQNDPSPATTPQQTSVFTSAVNTSFTSTVGKYLPIATTIYDPLNIGSQAAGVWTPPAGCYRVSYHGVYSDTSNESFLVEVQILKNSVSINNMGQSIFLGLVEATGEVPIDLEMVIAMNGTDTFGVYATLTGAAGTLSSSSLTQNCIISLA